MADSVWLEKNATLSDKTAKKEFGLTENEIIEAIKAGKLQYRRNYMHGNPYLRLIRSEIEKLVSEKYGKDELKTKKLQNELKQVNKEIRRLKTQLVSLEKRKSELAELLGKP